MEGVVERRVRILEQRLGGGDTCGPLALIASNSWSDADRAAWATAQILHDEDVESALIEKYAGHAVRPCRHVRQHILVIEVPAPASVEESSEAERAAWRERVSSRYPWRS
jgi:hypothetical protein